MSDPLPAVPDPIYGPDKPCRRTPCIDADPVTGAGAGIVANHPGGAHLDPYDRSHYDGIVTLYAASPHTVRSAAKPLLLHVGAFGPVDPHSGDDLRRATEVALTAAFQEIDRLRQQVAHAQVDADHKVRDASARALDCADHGRIITNLEAQVTHLAADRDRLEKARLALLSQHHHIGEWLDQRDIPGGAGASPDVRADEIANALRRVHTRTARAHQRAFTNREAS